MEKTVAPAVEAPVSLAREPLLAPDVWLEPMVQFAKASGLSLSLYNERRERVIGPIPGQGFGAMLRQEGFFAQGEGLAHEADLVQKALDTGAIAEGDFQGMLSLYAFPLIDSTRVVGIVTAGWAFRNFPNPSECARMARRMGLLENIFWLAARETAPIGGDKLNAFLSMLKTWNGAVLSQLLNVRQAQETSRLKDQFLAIASHELRTPLTSILLRTEVMRRAKSPTPEMIAGNLLAIERAAKIQARLVDDLLETSRLLTGKLTLAQDSFNPATLVQDAFETLKPTAESKGISLSLRQSTTKLHYVGDSMRMQQVFWNLVGNAIKFTEALGKIEIRSEEKDGQFIFRVTDTGRGLSKPELKALFEPFYQAPSGRSGSNSGLGLGLSIARAIVDLHGGRVAAASEGILHGSTFTVHLPAAEAMAQLA
ncbi:MAG: HAMP domain-containing histidine kinase [Proteobacteria bacterium]|nr:MAG: HAMP domain-containing histidine kinase [Pseudomonadota bacterium]